MKRILLALGAVALLTVLNTVTVVFTLSHLGLTRAGSNDLPAYKADGNDDGALNIADPIYLLQYLFNSGSPPAVFAGGGDAQFSDDEVTLLKDLLTHISIEKIDNGVGGENKTVRFSGVNVQIVN